MLIMMIPIIHAYSFFPWSCSPFFLRTDLCSVCQLKGVWSFLRPWRPSQSGFHNFRFYQVRSPGGNEKQKHRPKTSHFFVFQPLVLGECVLNLVLVGLIQLPRVLFGDALASPFFDCWFISSGFFCSQLFHTKNTFAISTVFRTEYGRFHNHILMQFLSRRVEPNNFHPAKAAGSTALKK